MEMESDPSVLFVDARVLDHTVKDNSKHRQLMPIRLVQADCVSISDDGHYCALYCHVYRRIDFWDILGPLFYLNRILLAVEYDIFQRILRCQQLSWSSCGGFIHALFVLSNGEQVISSVFDVFKRAMVSAWAM